MPAPDKIKQLVQTFEQNLNEYHTRKNETELRRQFLDPFFEALGWDVSNNKGNDERRKEVAHELSVEIDGQQKKADYAFRTGIDKFDFLVEAKKPSVKIESNPEPAFQVKRYGWSAKLPINILTDFEHFAVYDCRVKPNYKDKVTAGRIHLFHYKNYIEKWDEIAALFSPDAIRVGALNEFTEGLKTKKGTADVDDDFLAEIERWRDLLARNIANRNKDKGLTESQLNYAVQMTIDRIVFLRIAEERGMEEYGRLNALTQLSPTVRGDSIYSYLKQYFLKADERYNSGLFHFKTSNKTLKVSPSGIASGIVSETFRVSQPDTVTFNLQIDDKVLEDIIENLYEPKSPYAFAYIPTDILGSVYERFLGKVIRLTPSGQAKVEDKPEVRKAGGVYYTPTYIVEYIVKNTVGKLVDGKTPKEVAEIKVVDPACGSGSFLLGAYQYLLNWHLDWYVQNDPEKQLKNKVLLTQDNKTYRLSMTEKKRILLNNIHGVDVDPQAVEVTKLSLLLKVVEDPGQLTMFEEGHILPDLGNNIKCGNSLIGMDYFEGQLMVNGEEASRVNPFDWKNEFSQVFKRGGFDAVIGNPPYGTIIDEKTLQYFNSYYKHQDYQKDLYLLFLERYSTLIKTSNLLGVIISNTWLQSVNLRNIRQYMTNSYSWTKILHLTEKVFNAVVDTHVLIFRKSSHGIQDGDDIIVDFMKDEKDNQHHVLVGSFIPKNGDPINIVANPIEQLLSRKITSTSVLLETLFSVYNGIKPFEVGKGKPPQTEKIAKEQPYVIEGTQPDKAWKPLLRGGLISRYKNNWNNNYWVSYGEWLAAPRDPAIFDAPKKIMVRQTGDSIIATIIESGFVARNNMHIILAQSPNYQFEYLLGLMNSRLMDFAYRFINPEKGEALAEIKKKHVEQLPVRPIDFSNPTEKAKHDLMVTLVERMLALHKNLASAKTPQEKESMQRQVESTDGAIDKLVYELYGLSEEEIRIVES